MAEHFKFRILYVPLIPFSIDYETNVRGTFLAYLKPAENDFKQNHISYLKEDLVNKTIIFDPFAAELVKRFAQNRGYETKVHFYLQRKGRLTPVESCCCCWEKVRNGVLEARHNYCGERKSKMTFDL